MSDHKNAALIAEARESCNEGRGCLKPACLKGCMVYRLADALEAAEAKKPTVESVADDCEHLAAIFGGGGFADPVYYEEMKMLMTTAKALRTILAGDMLAAIGATKPAEEKK